MNQPHQTWFILGVNGGSSKVHFDNSQLISDNAYDRSGQNKHGVPPGMGFEACAASSTWCPLETTVPSSCPVRKFIFRTWEYGSAKIFKRYIDKERGSQLGMLYWAVSGPKMFWCNLGAAVGRWWVSLVFASLSVTQFSFAPGATTWEDNWRRPGRRKRCCY